MIFGPRIHKLEPKDQELARNVTGEILTVPIGRDDSFEMNITGPPPTGEYRRVKLPETINTGDFDGWLLLDDMVHLRPGNDSAAPVQQMTSNVFHAEESSSTSFLVPPDGISVVSDIDDILRDAQIWRWKHALKGAISQRFVPWKNMPGKCSIFSSCTLMLDLLK